ncbi:related to pseudouridine synthase [Ramularia collo-cygni]|uniref:tRNA pseudouridine(55) synthase n=1 Tax=Ramularia collo-cygni TaxID=112498 RepID=A0A2D3V3M7_9PEZI|nr:related to pseudouridine synthase [Ramularia collo-cygni]CZT14883.1 related to pseudouridine synthase [Ramularia collo-cygni]
MGHGGTLDPMATGVLILGVGQGTKELGYFTTGCTKSYEAVVLFGAATDTYDTEGKILERADTGHITRHIVEEKLARFKGRGVQRPPVFSALKVQGKKLYEYAREGKEVPVEIKERPVDASELEIVEWYEGGTHKWHWPTTEASEEEKAFAEKLLSKTEKRKAVSEGRKRERREDVEHGHETAPSSKRVKAEDETAIKTESTTVEQPAAPQQPCPAPACRIRMTVTSGFYVRSLCHDLGAAVGSAACMSSLVRTSQGGFELGSNVLWYDELKQGEDVWGPKVKAMLVENQKRSDARSKEQSNAGGAKHEGGQAGVKKEPSDEDAKPASTSGMEASDNQDNVKIKAEVEADVETKTENNAENASAAAPAAESKWRAGY